MEDILIVYVLKGLYLNPEEEESQKIGRLSLAICSILSKMSFEQSKMLVRGIADSFGDLRAVQVMREIGNSCSESLGAHLQNACLALILSHCKRSEGQKVEMFAELMAILDQGYPSCIKSAKNVIEEIGRHCPSEVVDALGEKYKDDTVVLNLLARGDNDKEGAWKVRAFFRKGTTGKNGHAQEVSREQIEGQLKQALLPAGRFDVEQMNDVRGLIKELSGIDGDYKKVMEIVAEVRGDLVYFFDEYSNPLGQKAG